MFSNYLAQSAAAEVFLQSQLLSCYITGATYDRRNSDLLSIKLEAESQRLVHLVSDLTLNKMILTVAALRNF